MTNYESLEVACVIKEKEVVCKYKGKRSEAKGQAGEVPEERNVTEEAGLEESWARSGSKSPPGSLQQRAPRVWVVQDGKVKREVCSRKGSA